MRIGWILARGSCSALKRLALFGVVFVLGAGSASAQIEFDGAADAVLEVAEGGSLSVKYKVRATSESTHTSARTFTVVLQLENDTTGRIGELWSVVGGDGKASRAETASADMPNTQSVTVTVPAHSGDGSDDEIKEVKGTILLSTVHDVDAEDEIAWLSAQVNNADNIEGADGSTDIGNIAQFVPLLIKDDETQGFDLSAADDDAEPTEGTNFEAGISLDPPGTNKVWNLNYRLPAGYTPIFGTGNRNPRELQGFLTATITIDPPENDGNRDDDTIELEVFDPSGSRALAGLDPLKLTFKDIHALPESEDITWKAFTDDDGDPSTTETTSITEGGDPVHVTFEVDRGSDNRPMGEALKVTPVLMGSARTSDFQLEGLTSGSLTLAVPSSGNVSEGTFMVYALADDDINVEPEELMFDLKVEGASTGTNARGPGEVMAAKPVMLKVEDTTEALLTPMAADAVEATVMAAREGAAAADGNDLFTSGEMFSVMGSALFTGSNIALSGSSSSEAVSVSSTGDAVMVTARSVGTATVTVTGTVASAATTSQTIHNIAQVMFDVKVDELPLEIMLSRPDDMMNITEGMDVMVTATANRAVTANTMVALVLTDGSASPDDYSVDEIMIMDGEMTGTATLTAVEDMMDERMETLTIEGRFGDGMKTNMLTFNIWDAAVPALPIIAQLLLAGLLAVGGWRRYLRR